MHKIPESVLVVIYTADLRTLLLERADRPGFWQSVTGSRDALDEPFRETARREVLEETGIDACLHRLTDWNHAIEYEIYPYWRHRYAPGVTRNQEHWFGLELVREVEVIVAAREHLNFMWLDYREAAQRCFSPSNSAAILELPRRSQGAKAPP
ncbi:MAG: dihydroneopterin triphosphate diphosphatase [Burkholderiaceae bacterium]|jgi:dATP pyrophosphohydrolase